MRLTPVQISGNTGFARPIVEVSLSAYHACARRTPNAAYCWGRNDNGELGDGTTQRRLVPTQISALGTTTRQLSAGQQHTCAIDSSFRLRCWGWNGFGQLGDGTTTQRLLPVLINGYSGDAVTGVSAKVWHTCATIDGDQHWCWGNNDKGELGDGTTIARSVPTPLDADGLPANVEDAAPNDGDGNDDGVPDRLQANVASLPDATGTSYVSVSTSCAQIADVKTLSEAQVGSQDSAFTFPLGLAQFRIPCASATVDLRFFGTAALNPPYRKFGPTTAGSPATAAWYSLPGVTFTPTSVGGQPATLVHLTLQDGQLGDDTGVDGTIVDVGGPTAPVAAVPAAPLWARAALAGAFLALAFAFGVQRRRAA